MDPITVALLAAGIGSGISGWFTSQSEKENAKAYSNASKANLEAFKKYYDEAFGEGSFNSEIQKYGEDAIKNYTDMLSDSEAWNKYIDGERAYEAPEKFSFNANDVFNDPSYQFRLQQGLNATDWSNVASGLNLSSKAANDATRYAQNFASQEYANAYNRANQQYNTDKQFDYTKWLNEANQYYNNLTKQLNGQQTVANMGINANNSQAQALSGIAQQTANTNNQVAASEAMSNNADSSFWSSIFSNLINAGSYGIASSGTSGSNPTVTDWSKPIPANSNLWNRG